jgi:hypothetical protein
MGILALGLVARAALGPADVVLNMLGQGAACARIVLVAAALNVGLSVVLVPVLGLPGAAAASLALFCCRRRQLRAGAASPEREDGDLGCVRKRRVGPARSPVLRRAFITARGADRIEREGLPPPGLRAKRPPAASKRS